MGSGVSIGVEAGFRKAAENRTALTRNIVKDATIAKDKRSLNFILSIFNQKDMNANALKVPRSQKLIFYLLFTLEFEHSKASNTIALLT